MDNMPMETTESDYTKNRKKRMELARKALKANPDNSVLKELVDDYDEEVKRQENQAKGNDNWGMVHEAVWAAERACTEEDVPFDKCIADLVDALGAIRWKKDNYS